MAKNKEVAAKSQKRALQKFKKSDVVESTSTQIAEFLEDFQNMLSGGDEKTKAISLRIPENVLRMFKSKSKSQGKKYQSVIVELMRSWLK